MEFLVQRTSFLQLLSRIESVISTKPLKSALGFILLEAKEHFLKVSGTDLLVAIQGRVEAKITHEGSIALPAAALTQLVKNITAPTIELRLDGTTATLKAGDAVFKLRGMEPRDYPEFPSVSPTAKEISLDGPLFKRALQRVAFAAIKEDTRYILTGILFQASGETLELVATDGKKLARSEVSLEQPINETCQVVVPFRGVDEIIKNLPKEGAVKLFFCDEEKIALSCADVFISINLLSGDFPDFKQVIPQTAEYSIFLDKEEFSSLLRQTTLFANDSGLPVRLTVSQGDLKVSAVSKDLGEGNVSMPVSYSGPILNLAFNPQHLLEILKTCSLESIQLSLNSPYDPTIIVENEAMATYNPQAPSLYMVMPMRLEDPI